MVADLKEIGLTEASLEKVKALKQKRPDRLGVWADLRPILREDEVAGRERKEIDDRIARTGRPRPGRAISGPIEGFEAQGYRGQYLVVIPEHRIVAVRQLRAPKIEFFKTDDFAEFRRMVRELAPARPPTSPPARPSR